MPLGVLLSPCGLQDWVDDDKIIKLRVNEVPELFVDIAQQLLLLTGVVLGCVNPDL